MSKSGMTAVVTTEEVTVALAKGYFTAEEDKVLRMRHGAKVGLTTPLARAAGSNTELADELLLMEMQLHRTMKARAGIKPASGIKVTQRNAAKDKIVRSLKGKK